MSHLQSRREKVLSWILQLFAPRPSLPFRNGCDRETCQDGLGASVSYGLAVEYLTGHHVAMDEAVEECTPSWVPVSLTSELRVLHERNCLQKLPVRDAAAAEALAPIRIACQYDACCGRLLYMYLSHAPFDVGLSSPILERVAHKSRSCRQLRGYLSALLDHERKSSNNLVDFVARRMIQR